MVSLRDRFDAARSAMSRASALARALAQEDLNFLLTNRIPRRAATHAAGWWSRIESPRLTRLSIAAWQAFGGDLRLEEAKVQTFDSVRACFTRELRPGARPIDRDPAVLTSPCDAVVGAFGRLSGIDALQIKGSPYSTLDLLGDPDLAERHRDGLFVTLRLRSCMYHRFHAPCDGRMRRVIYISGDTWNVNPIALRRIERLFCRNERAVLEFEPRAGDLALTLVPVAAILVASIRVHAIGDTLHLRRRGPDVIACAASYEKGDELGYFENGSTIVAFIKGPYEFAPEVREGTTIRAGQALLRRIDPHNLSARVP
ncbi:MAG: phosphatidylserine decarboxylase [Myxococcales bacterium]|nr:phosphatidylserine decarboxylase [Myxococcales bacterium]